MDWAMITWGLLIGMAGLIWTMVLAVRQDRQDKPATAEIDSAPSAGSVRDSQDADHNDRRCAQRNAA